jgi:two-component system nitrate/nitrite response regulator NarL
VRRVDVFLISRLRLDGEVVSEVLARQPQLRIRGEATDRETAVESIRTLEPDVVLIDADGEGSVETVRAIRRVAPSADVIVIGVPEEAQTMLEYVEAGVSGYVSRAGSMTDLLEAIESVTRGEIACPERLVATVFERIGALAANRPLWDENRPQLTPRELEIARLIEEGLSNREIADRLCIAPATVKNHLHNIFEKLQVRRRGEAAALVRAHPSLRD